VKGFTNKLKMKTVKGENLASSRRYRASQLDSDIWHINQICDMWHINQICNIISMLK